MRKWWVWCQLGKCPSTRTLPTCLYSKLCLRRHCGKFLGAQGLCVWNDSQTGVGSGGWWAELRARGEMGGRARGTRKVGLQGWALCSFLVPEAGLHFLFPTVSTLWSP